MDPKTAIMDTIGELQRSAPKGSETYRGYEQLKETVKNTNDKIRLAHMHKQLKEVLEEILKEEGIESVPMPDTNKVDPDTAHRTPYPGAASPRLRRKINGGTA